MFATLFSFLDESARWLVGAGRFTEAREVLLRVARSRGDIDERRVDEILQVTKKKYEQVSRKRRPTINCTYHYSSYSLVDNAPSIGRAAEYFLAEHYVQRIMVVWSHANLA